MRVCCVACCLTSPAGDRDGVVAVVVHFFFFSHFYSGWLHPLSLSPFTPVALEQMIWWQDSRRRRRQLQLCFPLWCTAIAAASLLGGYCSCPATLSLDSWLFTVLHLLFFSRHWPPPRLPQLRLWCSSSLTSSSSSTTKLVATVTWQILQNSFKHFLKAGSFRSSSSSSTWQVPKP